MFHSDKHNAHARQLGESCNEYLSHETSPDSLLLSIQSVAGSGEKTQVHCGATRRVGSEPVLRVKLICLSSLSESVGRPSTSIMRNRVYCFFPRIRKFHRPSHHTAVMVVFCFTDASGTGRDNGGNLQSECTANTMWTNTQL